MLLKQITLTYILLKQITYVRGNYASRLDMIK